MTDATLSFVGMGASGLDCMAKKLVRKGQRVRLKTNCEIGRFFLRMQDACQKLWNKFCWLNKNRLILRLPILRYHEMARFLVLFKQTNEMSFLKDVPSQVLQQVLMDLDRAYRDGFDKNQPRKRLPRFRRRQDSIGMRFPQGFKFNNRRMFLPKVGWVGFFKSQDFGDRPKSVTVRSQAGKWYASVLAEEEISDVAKTGPAVGLDLGVAKLATLSDGTVYETRRDKNLEKKLVCAQKNLSRKKKDSKNRFKQIVNVQKVHFKVACARNDYLHKVTNEVSSRNAIAFVEDLRVSNMSKSARGTIENPGRNVAAKSGLNRSILAQGFREFRRQLGYKLEWRGGKMIAVNPRHTSQMCSGCGFVSSCNRTSQSQFRCLECGLELNADFNAALNILNRGLKIMAAGQAVTVCGEVAMAASAKQKPVRSRKTVSPQFMPNWESPSL